ncbi:MAG: transglutaminase-like domain-containing protein [Candidatus Omnitrophota bacterium]|nr:transglutaminase-like domain-containing protein [Candidatus Omnitrophota bacterium]
MKKIFKQKQVSVMKKLFLSILCLLSLPSLCLSQNIEGVTSFIHNPAQLSKWLSKEFRYELEFPDYWQPAQETLNSKKGDCEDFAILTQEILKGLGIKSDIIIVVLKDLKQSHALCMFKDGESYSYFSNQNLIQTNAGTIKEAIQEEHPDWDSIVFTNAKKQYVKIIRREK